MKVRRQKGDNSYCGPAAISLLTGRTVPVIAAKLRDITGDRAIKGVHQWDMRAALRQFGKTPIVVPVRDNPSKRPTLVAAIKKLKGRGANDRFLITLTSHYIVLKGRKIYDNHNPTGIFLRQYAHRRTRVISVEQVS